MNKAFIVKCFIVLWLKPFAQSASSILMVLHPNIQQGIGYKTRENNGIVLDHSLRYLNNGYFIQ
jgi:hypothetical protein